MHSGLAGVALISATVGLPLVLTGLPWLLALSDEGLFPLLGLVRCGSAWFGVEIVLLVFVDFGQTSSRMLVDLKVILI